MQNNDNVSPENQPKIEVDNNGNADDFIAEVIPDDSNPQTGLTTTTSYRSDNAGGSNSPNKSDGGGSGSGSKTSRREASRIKNPGKIFVGGIPGSGKSVMVCGSSKLIFNIISFMRNSK